MADYFNFYEWRKPGRGRGKPTPVIDKTFATVAEAIKYRDETYRHLRPNPTKKWVLVKWAGAVIPTPKETP